MAETRTVYLIMSYQVLTDQFLHTLLPAVIGWLSRVKQAGGGGGLGSLPEEVSCVQSQHREGCEEGGLGMVAELLSPRHAQLNPDQAFLPLHSDM